jgi:iron complex outermembrane receptor protein
MLRRILVAAVLPPLFCSAAAHAQRTDDNAVTQADDAFGKSVGNEQIGIYNPFDVRGFSPVDAGNVRLEGLFFDQQTSPSDRLVDGSTIRVGLTAQGYPFPAPTGIADYTLRKPGKEALAGTVLRIGPFGATSLEIDAQLPISDRLGVAGGIALDRDNQHYGATPRYLSTALIPVWRPAPGVEIVPFWSRMQYRSEEPQTLLFTAGDFLPPRIKRGPYYGQKWEKNRGANSNYGLLATVPIAGFEVRAGIFRSIADQDLGFADLLTGVEQDGSAAGRIAIADADNRFASTSGELRVSRSFTEGKRVHRLIASVRARAQDRRYGGADVIELGPTQIGTRDYEPKPTFNFGVSTRDRVRQSTVALGYQGVWPHVGELSLGIQKTDYRKTIDDPAQVLPASRDKPWLFSAAGAAYLTSSIVLYGGYTRGLEESPIAPDIAVNRNQAPPAIKTRQADAGIRWSITPTIKAVAGVFEVVKPYYNVDPDLRFRSLGEVRHRGIELSLAGQPLPGLTVVAGTVFLDASVSGEEVDAGLIGGKPIAAIERYTVASIDYRLPQVPGLSFDAIMESTGDRVANAANTLVVPPRAVLSLGSRYRFKVGKTPALLRAQVGNVFNKYGYGVGGSGFFVYNVQRRVTLTVAADI